MMSGGVTKLGIVSGSTLEVPRVPAEKLSVADFYTKYMLPNVPVIITNVGKAWLANSWANEEGKGLRVEKLLAEFSSLEASAHNCNPHKKVLGGFRIEQKTVGEYMEWWQHKPATFGPDDDLWYLKDWNFMKGTNESCKLYERPPYFAEDWLNEFEQAHCSDHRFVYLGPKGVLTPLHRDVLCSFSWSVNMFGRKKWWLLPPEFEEDLVSADGKSHLFDLRDIATVSREEFPHLSQRTQDALIVLEQGTHEVMFVPSGWWHQVENLEDTLSINHNWLNGANIQWSWKLLQAEVAKIRDTVEDCGEDEWLAQEVLKLRFGFNYVEFFKFLCEILDHELERAAGTVAQSKHKKRRKMPQEDETGEEKAQPTAHTGGEDWAATVALRIQSLTRIQSILEELQQQEACLEAECELPTGLSSVTATCDQLRETLDMKEAEPHSEKR